MVKSSSKPLERRAVVDETGRPSGMLPKEAIIEALARNAA